MILRNRFFLGIALPSLVFISCTIIASSQLFRVHQHQLTTGILLDILLVAPLLTFITIRKSDISKTMVLKVFVVGLFVCGLFLPGIHSPFLDWTRRWIAPASEFVLIAFLVAKFRSAGRKVRNTGEDIPDFLFHCRKILKELLRNEKIANGVASEVAVFYYLFSGKKKTENGGLTFSIHKRTGVIVILFVFVSETVGMHFVFMLWNRTAAFVLTGISIYTCLQFIAHMRAIKTRPVIVLENKLILRNGLMGGDVIIPLQSVSAIEVSGKRPGGKDIVKLAFFNSFENHSVILHLDHQVSVTKAFGLQKKANVLLLCIDDAEKFAEAVNYSLRK